MTTVLDLDSINEETVTIVKAFSRSEGVTERLVALLERLEVPISWGHFSYFPIEDVLLTVTLTEGVEFAVIVDVISELDLEL